MQNNQIENPYVEIDLDKKRRLEYDLNAFILIEEQTGRDFLNLKQQANEEWVPGLKDLRVLLWAGLAAEDEALTLRQAGSLIKMSKLKYITDKFNEAFAMAMGPKAPAEPKAETEPAKVVAEAA